MIPIELQSLVSFVDGWMFASMRVLGCLLAFPLFSFRAHPIRLRIGLALLLGFIVAPVLPSNSDVNSYWQSYATAAVELTVGYFAGWIVRVCLMAFDILAEIIGIQTGLSYAASVNLDPSLSSGVLGEFLALLAIAVSFTLNSHLVFIKIIVDSFQYLPLGVWPEAWSWLAILEVLSKTIAVGITLSLPVILVYLIFNICQAILVRVSPQLNLFAVGFAISVPVAFFVLSFVISYLGVGVERALTPGLELVDSLKN